MPRLEAQSKLEFVSIPWRTVKRAGRPKLETDDRLRRAPEVLREEGIQGVRVKRLASDSQVTKGSFYWPFRDVSELRASLLGHWRKRYNDEVMSREEYLSGDPASLLISLVTEVRRDGLDRYELAIRVWADHDQEAVHVVRTVCQQRNGFVFQVFQRIGFSTWEMEARTHLTLRFLSWEPNMFSEYSNGRRESLARQVHELVMK